MCANRIFLGESQHWSRAKMCFIFTLGPTELWRESLPQWTDNVQHTFACSASSFCLTSVVERPRSNRPHVRRACVFIIFVSDCSWRQGYSGETGTLMTCDKGIQSWPTLKLSLDFLSFSHHFLSELSWQLLCGRKTLRCCFSMSLWSTVIQPRPVLPVVTSHDSFNMLLVSRDSAKYSSNVNLMICRCQLLLWFEMS